MANNKLRPKKSIQARRQDSVTGGAEINFEGTREVCFREFERSTGAREIYSSLNQTIKVKKKCLRFQISANSGIRLKIRAIVHEFTKKKKKKKGLRFKIFTNSNYRLKILAIFYEFLREDQKQKKFFVLIS